MDQLYAEIFGKISTYIKVIEEFKSDVKEVRIYNQIVDLFAKTYCQIHIEIKLKETVGHSAEHYFNITLFDHFTRFDKKYFSFYIGHTDYYTDRDSEVEEVHYDYIRNLLAWNLLKNQVPFRADPFVSEGMKRYQEQQRRVEYQKEQDKIEAAVKSLAPEVGQLVAIKQYSMESLRLARVIEVQEAAKRNYSYYSMKLTEVLKDLSLGKREISFYSKSNLYAIIEPSDLPKKCTKAELLKLLELGETFPGLEWRRPQSLWE